MRKIIGLIRTYFKEHFSFSYFIPVVLFTAVLIWVNYTYNFERTYITYEFSQGKKYLMYCLMYFTAFGGAYLSYLFSRKDREVVFSGRLWAMIIAVVLLFSFRYWFHSYDAITNSLVPIAYQTVVKKYIMNLEGFIWLFIPCAVYWYIVDRKEQPIYGFHSNGVVLKPYFILLMLMVPLVIAAATQKDFLETYPRAFHLGLSQEGGLNKLLTFLYEICYAADFVTTEFFFRGVLILAFARFAGPRVILPMCVFYVTIHFEKPLGETISSFFGGWILGILAYETRSIYGGIIVHLGIAMLMEVVAFVAHAL
jgi:hypothetical protein